MNELKLFRALIFKFLHGKEVKFKLVMSSFVFHLIFIVSYLDNGDCFCSVIFHYFQVSYAF